MPKAATPGFFGGTDVSQINPISADFNIKGLDKVIRDLRALPRELAGKNGGPVRRALFQAAKVFREEAKRRAPRGQNTPLPGRLKKNIVAKRERNPAKFGATEMYTVYPRTDHGEFLSRARSISFARSQGQDVTGLYDILHRAMPKNAFYAYWVEYGTAKMPARPFMRPAGDGKAREATEVFSRFLKKDVDKLNRKVR